VAYELIRRAVADYRGLTDRCYRRDTRDVKALPKQQSSPTEELEPVDEANGVLIVAWVNRLCRDGTARRLRLDHNLSLRRVGDACHGADPAAVLRWERGERFPRGDRALAYGSLLAALLEMEA
jgi:hypothetical protein